MQILIVDDEAPIRELLAFNLKKNGYTIQEAADGPAALQAVQTAAFDLILLDLMLPGVDGVEICTRLREESDVPVIMLTARTDTQDVVAGLEAGADDYVPKPFSPRVLMARIRAQLRKDGTGASKIREIGANQVLKVGSRIEVDQEMMELRKDGDVIPVTRSEFMVFSVLASRPIRTWSRDMIIQTALGDDYEGFDRTVDTYIKNLRKKLAEPGHENGWIQTVHGFGYRIEDAG